MSRTFLPTNYLDESVPPPRATASAWIVALPGGRYAIEAEDEDEAPTWFIKPGDTVEFNWTESYGFIEVTVAPDGSFTTHRTPDPRATLFWIKGDPDSMTDSVKTFAQDWIEMHTSPQTVELEQYAWSDKPDLYRFEIGPDGPHFKLEA